MAFKKSDINSEIRLCLDSGCFHLRILKRFLNLQESSLNEFVKKIRTTDHNSDEFRHIPIELHTRTLVKIKSTILDQLFQKFLQLRCPLQSNVLNEAISIVLVSSLAVHRENTEDFDPQILWKLMKNLSSYRNYEAVILAWLHFISINFLLPEHEENNRLLKISLFGEFIYFISIMHRDSDSPMVQIRKSATEGECLLIDEMSMTVTPKLGILTFIAFRNYATYLDDKIVTLLLGNHLQAINMYPSIHISYVSLVKEIRSIPQVNDFFELFLRYLCTSIGISPMRFVAHSNINFEDLDEIQDDDNLMADPEGTIFKRRLVFILNHIVDIILFLYKEHGACNFQTFKFLPNYLQNYSMPEDIESEKSNILEVNGSFHSVEAVLVSLSFLLDFFFVENWNSDVTEDYVTICNEIKQTLESRGESLAEIAREAALFPFV